ncbi:MAG: hypothetical protein QW775_03065 [Ignisphaera sp.]|uniref:Uncharacterized protein n=1 Tax=Ignisphaera aggregans TaxID=334771 RepID=A0A7C4NKN1_9CREN
MSNLGKLKDYLRSYLMKRVPGHLTLLNILCISRYNADCISLALVSPSRLYSIVLAHYRGDIISTDYAFLLVFINPIIELLKKPELGEELLYLAKTGKDKEFIELIDKYLSSSEST